MNIRSLRLLLFALTSLSLGAFAQQAYTLQQAIEYGLQNQTQVKNSLIDAELAMAKKNEVRAIGLPHINGSLDIRDFLQIPTQLIPGEFFLGPQAAGTFIPVKFGTKYNATAGIDASWLLLDASYFVGLQGATVYLDLARKNIQRTKNDAVVAISKAYYSSLIAEERMKLLNSNVDRVKKLRDDTQVLYTNGFVEKLDLDRIEVTYNNLLIEKDKIQRLIDLSKTLLKYQMGLDLTAQVTLADSLKSVNITDPSAEKVDLTKRIEYQLLESQVKAGKLLIMREQASFFPNIVLYGSGSATAQRQEFNFTNSEKWYPTVLVGARLGVPIFSGGMRHYKVQQAKLNLQKMQNEKTFVEQSLNLEMTNAKIMLANASFSLENQKKNITVAEEVYRVSKIKYEQGVGSNLEVLTAETALKEAQTNYYNALFDALIAKVEYEKASGTIIYK
jgi:outer membrane protein